VADVIRAICTLAAVNGVSKDSCVNVLHFKTVSRAGEIEEIVASVQAYYDMLSSKIGASISRETSSVRCYALSDPKPREPLVTASLGMTQPGNSELPREVGLVTSWQATEVSGSLSRRFKGRTFVGPLSGDATLDGDNMSRPTTGTVAKLVQAANVLLARNDANQEFSIYSVTDQVARKVTSGYVDNAWDTVRSRGQRDTIRSRFPPP
jgi:hypothetical protein